MTMGFATLVGAIAGFLAHLVGKTDGLTIGAIFFVVIGVIAGWLFGNWMG